MASNERLTKRVKKIEDWVKENEEMGGPKGYLDTIVTLINSTREAQNQVNTIGMNMQRLRELLNEFLAEQELGEEWNKFLEDRDNAIQEQQTEEVSVQEQAESSEEVSETPEEKKK
mgnify:CR=1 FL=1|tara:strand:- start:165 stop:512 length:348 start_codon:yes stop_codon:yes gene_type:complete